MSTTTTSYALNTPTPGSEEDTWGALVNDNFDDLDDILDGTTAVECIRLKAYSMSGDDIDPDSGQLPYKTISTNTTFTESFAEGDAVILTLTIASGAVPSWPTMQWVGGAEPTLANGTHQISLMHVNSVLIGNYLGPVS